MARSDLVLKLVKAGISGNETEVRSTAEAIAAEERAKKHVGVAERIRRILNTNISHNSGKSFQKGIRVSDGSGGVLRREPHKQLSDLYLTKSIKSACNELIEEQSRADLLRSNGFDPRHRILLSGPPGNGKTTLAEALAFELALPLFVVRYDTIITSYLGETAQRLRRLFDYVKTEPCVLFFDEFDALGKERGDIHETGEIKRVVTTLLLQIDDLPSYCIVVGATNHPELLDRATWRRFELRLNLAQPTDTQMIDFFSDSLKRIPGAPGYSAKKLFSEIKPKNFSEAENFFLDVHRRIILSGGEIAIRSIITDRIRAWKEKMIIPGEMIDHGKSSNHPTS